MNYDIYIKVNALNKVYISAKYNTIPAKSKIAVLCIDKWTLWSRPLGLVGHRLASDNDVDEGGDSGDGDDG